MAEKPKKKLPDGTLVDVDILAAEATKAEKDINGVPLVNRVGEVYTHPEKQNTIVVVYSNGIKQEYTVNNVSEANHASTAENANNATHDDQGNVIHQTYVNKSSTEEIGGVKKFTSDIQVKGVIRAVGNANSSNGQYLAIKEKMIAANSGNATITVSDDGNKFYYNGEEIASLKDVDEKLDKTGGEVNGSLTVLPGHSVQVDTIYNYDVGTRILLDNEGIYYDKTLEGKKSSNEIVTKADLEALKQEIPFKSSETILFEGNTLLTNDFNVVNKNQITHILLSDYVAEGDIIKVYITGNDTYSYIKGGIIEFEISKYTRDDGKDFYFGSSLYMADYEYDQTTIISASIREFYNANHLHINVRNLEEYDSQAGGVPAEASELYVKKVIRIRQLKEE